MIAQSGLERKDPAGKMLDKPPVNTSDAVFMGGFIWEAI